MSRIFKILLTQFRELSLAEFSMLILRNVYQAVPLLIYTFNLQNITKDSSTELADYDISKGTFDDLEGVRNRINPLPWEFQCDLFDNVTDFFIAKDGSGIQCICWIYYSEDHNRILKLGPNEAEIKFCLTLPEARGRGLYPIVINAILQYLRDKGLTYAYMCVHKDNKASIRGIEKAGFERIGSLTLRKVFGFQISKQLVTSEAR